MHALILAGGSGTRFWPLSRRHRPKQLLTLDGDRSLLRRTVDRLQTVDPPPSVWVCTTEELRQEVAAELPDIPSSQILAEPVGRNTAPAIAWSLASMPDSVRDEAVVVLPADHRIGNDEAFVRVLTSAAALATERDLVLAMGVTPRWVETGYGYLELAEPIEGEAGLHRVARFTEKPDRAAAERFVASGRYRWNAGIFVFRASTMLRLVAEHLPDLASGIDRIGAEPSRLREVYGDLPAISIDHGIMEKLDSIATLPLDCGWSDLGSWEALADVLTATAGAEVTRGHVVALDSGSNLLWADEGTIAVIGVSGLTVVRTGDAVLVVPTQRSQEVRRLVDHLAAAGRDDLL